MARLFLFLLMVGVVIAVAIVIVNAGSRLLRSGTGSNGPWSGQTGSEVMAPTGIQKAAYIALIVVLFGVASGWLGGL